MVVQRSYFTVHGTVRDGLDRLSIEPGSHLMQVFIPSSAIRLIQEQLMLVGISETTVFPDLEGLCRELKQQWTRRS
jgi:hypothetical protein